MDTNFVNYFSKLIQVENVLYSPHINLFGVILKNLCMYLAFRTYSKQLGIYVIIKSKTCK